MPAQAAGLFRRTDLERSDQQLAWDRTDQAFFAAGACHVLAWGCRAFHQDRALAIHAIRFAGQEQVFHTYAVWESWAFDHSGWNAQHELLEVNAEFEDRNVEGLNITVTLSEFCAEHHHRMPGQYWRDPMNRARDYVARFRPPWS